CNVDGLVPARAWGFKPPSDTASLQVTVLAAIRWNRCGHGSVTSEVSRDDCSTRPELLVDRRRPRPDRTHPIRRQGGPLARDTPHSSAVLQHPAPPDLETLSSASKEGSALRYRARCHRWASA